MASLLKSLFGFTDDQARSVFVWAGVTLVVLVALAVLNAALWLMSGLWNISEESPFGLWGFAVAVLIATAAGFVARLRLARSPQKKTETSDRSASLVDRLRSELEASTPDVSPAERARWGEALGETPTALRNRIAAAITKADASDSKDDVASAEQLLSQLVAMDPASEEWARPVRWELEQIRKRL